MSVGKNEPRRDGPAKLTGRAKYLDDLDIPGCWHGVTVRSTVAHGKIKSISYDPAFPWDQCVIATAKDIPGLNVVTLIEPDQPLLADGIVRHKEEAVVLIAHPDRATAYEAAKRVKIEYEPLPPVLDMEKSEKSFKNFLISRGDLDAGFAAAEVIVEGEYRTPSQEQAYIENNAVAAYEEDGILIVTGSLQCPYYVL